MQDVTGLRAVVRYRIADETLNASDSTLETQSAGVHTAFDEKDGPACAFDAYVKVYRQRRDGGEWSDLYVSLSGGPELPLDMLAIRLQALARALGEFNKRFGTDFRIDFGSEDG